MEDWAKDEATAHGKPDKPDHHRRTRGNAPEVGGTMTKLLKDVPVPAMHTGTTIDARGSPSGGRRAVFYEEKQLIY